MGQYITKGTYRNNPYHSVESEVIKVVKMSKIDPAITELRK